MEPMTWVTGVPTVPPVARRPPFDRVNVPKPTALSVTGLALFISTPAAERVSRLALPVAALPDAARRITSDVEPVTATVLRFEY